MDKTKVIVFEFIENYKEQFGIWATIKLFLFKRFELGAELIRYNCLWNGVDIAKWIG